MSDNKEIIVIGGGPAGMMAAGTAAQKGKEVLLLEKNNKPGRKLRITGKGRCNITNDTDVEGLIDNIPINPNFLYSAFYSFSSQQLINFLQQQGLQTKVERGDRVFPTTDRAQDVVQVMLNYLHNQGVSLKQGDVEKVERGDNYNYIIILKNGERFKTDSLIIATGGLSYPSTGSTGDGYQFARNLGHTITPLYPSLVPLVVKEDWPKEVQGLTLKNIEITVYSKYGKEIFNDFGEMLFTHFGISGPVVLSASSHMRNMKNEKYFFTIDLKPALDNQKLDHRIQRDFKKYSRKYFSNSLGDLLPSKLIPVIIRLSSIPYDKTVNQITRQEREELVNLMKNLTLTVIDYRPIDEAIITSGGVDVDEVNPSTMEPKVSSGLYFAGEILDVDGYTGGFNLQIAFSTGFLAGMNC